MALNRWEEMKQAMDQESRWSYPRRLLTMIACLLAALGLVYLLLRWLDF